MKIGFWDNHDIRDNGTCVRAVKSLVQIMESYGYKVGENVRRMHRPPRQDDDPDWAGLNIWVDDGRDDIDWLPPRPNTAWMIDTHLGYPKRLFWAKQFDHVFCAQQSGVVQMRKDGIKNAHWLPLACHPQADPNLSELMLHPSRPQLTGGKPLDKMYDVGFVGFLNNGTGEPNSHSRIDYLDAMFKAFPESWMSFQRFFEEAAIVYVRSRLGFNISIKDDLNMRFFEVPSYGTALFSNMDAQGWQVCNFEDGKNFIGYDANDMAGMIEKAKYYLDHPVEREQIAEAGHKLVRGQHTYHHRLEQMLQVCGIKL